MLLGGKVLLPWTRESDDYMLVRSCVNETIEQAISVTSSSDGGAPAAGEAAGHAAAAAPPGGSELVTVRCAAHAARTRDARAKACGCVARRRAAHCMRAACELRGGFALRCWASSMRRRSVCCTTST
jgi:hypothetical protein